MWLLAGNREAATKLADAVLAALDARPGEPSFPAGQRRRGALDTR